MGNDKDIKRSFWHYAAISAALAVIFLFVKRDNVIRWVQSGITLARQERQIEFYHNDIERLDNEIHMLSTDRDTLERYAREHFGFAEPGDDVYMEE